MFKSDLLMKSFPTVTLTTFLLLEKNNPSSFWKPYIDILPQIYTIPLFYTFEECLELKGSPVLGFFSSISLFSIFYFLFFYFLFLFLFLQNIFF